MRNVYAVLNYGDWADDDTDSDPFLQLLSTTNVVAAHNDFVQVRMGGVDTTASSQWALLPASEEVHSPVSEEEKKKEYQEMILSRWPYIFVGCLVFVLLVAGFVIWRCCCRKGRKNRGCCCCGRNKTNAPVLEKHLNSGRKSDSYLPLQEGTLKANASLMSFNNSAASLHPQSAYSAYGIGQGKDHGSSGFDFPEPTHVGGGYR